MIKNKREDYTDQERELAAKRELAVRKMFTCCGCKCYKDPNSECSGDCPNDFPNAPNQMSCEPDYLVLDDNKKRTLSVEVTGALKPIGLNDPIWISECKIKNAKNKLDFGLVPMFIHFARCKHTGKQRVLQMTANENLFTHLENQKINRFGMHTIQGNSPFFIDISDAFEDIKIGATQCKVCNN